MSQQHDPVAADLNRYLDEQASDDRHEEAVLQKALDLRREWSMDLWLADDDGKWNWQILDLHGEHIAGERTRTEDEAWIGLREGMDRESRKAAEK